MEKVTGFAAWTELNNSNTAAAPPAGHSETLKTSQHLMWSSLHGMISILFVACSKEQIYHTQLEPVA